MRIERTEAVSRLHDQMFRDKNEERLQGAQISNNLVEQLEHRTLCFEKRLMKLETDLSFVKV